MRTLLLAALAFVAMPANATPIQLDFTGRVEDPRSEYFQQSVEASFTFDRVLAFGYQVSPTRDDCIQGVDATLGISSASVTLSGNHVDIAPTTAVFRADGLCSGFFSYMSIFDGDAQLGGFGIDLQGTWLSEMFASDDLFAAVFRPQSNASTLSIVDISGAGGHATVIQVPEPGTVALFGLGLLGVALSHRKRAKILRRV